MWVKLKLICQKEMFCSVLRIPRDLNKLFMFSVARKYDVLGTLL